MPLPPKCAPVSATRPQRSIFNPSLLLWSSIKDGVQLRCYIFWLVGQNFDKINLINEKKKQTYNRVNI